MLADRRSAPRTQRSSPSSSSASSRRFARMPRAALARQVAEERFGVPRGRRTPASTFLAAYDAVRPITRPPAAAFQLRADPRRVRRLHVGRDTRRDRDRARPARARQRAEPSSHPPSATSDASDATGVPNLRARSAHQSRVAAASKQWSVIPAGSARTPPGRTAVQGRHLRSTRGGSVADGVAAGDAGARF